MKAELSLTESATDWRSGNALSRGLSVSFVEAHAKRSKQQAQTTRSRRVPEQFCKGARAEVFFDELAALPR
jgi:hypothetical protein